MLLLGWIAIFSLINAAYFTVTQLGFVDAVPEGSFAAAFLLLSSLWALFCMRLLNRL
jgi:ABC-type arginine transport system permease subunit